MPRSAWEQYQWNWSEIMCVLLIVGTILVCYPSGVRAQDTVPCPPMDNVDENFTEKPCSIPGFTSCLNLSVTLFEGQSAFATCVTSNDIVEVRFCPLCTEDVLNSPQCVQELSITNENHCHRHGSLYLRLNSNGVVDFLLYNASIEDNNTTIACLHINTDNPVMPDLSSACLIVMTSDELTSTVTTTTQTTSVSPSSTLPTTDLGPSSGSVPPVSLDPTVVDSTTSTITPSPTTMFVACDEACRITLGVVILLALVCIIIIAFVCTCCCKKWLCFKPKPTDTVNGTDHELSKRKTSPKD